MSRTLIRDQQRRSPRALVFRLVLLLVVVGIAAWFLVGPTPVIDIQLDRPGIGPSTQVQVTTTAGKRGLGPVRVWLEQQDATYELVSEAFEPQPFWAFWASGTREWSTQVEVGKETLPGLVEGPAVLAVEAGTAGTWLRRPAPAVERYETQVHLTPPSISVTSGNNNGIQGGSSLVTYRVGPTATRHGVQAGSWWFPGYDAPAGDLQGASTQGASTQNSSTGSSMGDEKFALFGLPYDLDDTAQLRLVAEDALGNRVSIPFLDSFRPRPLQTGDIRLDDAFLAKVVPAILAQTPEIAGTGDLLADYLKMNSELRAHNAEQLHALGDDSVPQQLWQGRFLQLPRSAVMSPFAARRSYAYQGRQVDTQDHLGYDLASVRRAPVPAANNGRVVLARYLGIYGNTVVLDHGYGVMSLYAHLSGIDVAVGDTVESGQDVGRTGATGMAGGDHLHFTLMIRGLAVDPKEWWDGDWMRELQERLQPAPVD